jgi:CubicO group peptidase (beta-lactamase class C family)
MLRRSALVAALAVLLTAGGAASAQVAAPAAGPERTDLRGVAPRPLTGARRAAFEAYVADALFRFGVPGASVAVVQGGDVVYLKGFGVRVAGSTQGVTPDTMMMIGSITKPLTTMLAGTLIDDGRLTWDTPLRALLPDFAVGDPELTRTLTVRDAFCNCIGLPGRNVESYFESGRLTPETVVTALAGVAPVTERGELFQYNNLLISAGGYALGAAAEGSSGDLGLAYDTALRERVLGPIGMARSTFEPEDALAAGDYALPHAANLSGELRPLPLMAERALLPVRPAGALWSNAREMARFLQTELARGVAPDGTRVVSVANLEAAWAPEVAVPNLYGGPPEMAASMSGYGLGWNIGAYRGLRVISHAGGSGGFTAEAALLPEAGVGIAVLANAAFDSTGFFAYAVQFRLLELLFDQPAEMDAALAEANAGLAPRLRPALGAVDPAAAAPYVGRYGNPDLGPVILSLRDGRLILDAGELGSELRPRADGAAVHLFYDPPLSLFTWAYRATLAFSGGADAPRLILSVPANPTGPAQEFVFEPVSGWRP